MRYLLGIVATIIILSLSALAILSLWGITPTSWEFIGNVLISVLVVCIAVFLLAGCYYLFFKKYRIKDNFFRDVNNDF